MVAIAGAVLALAAVIILGTVFGTVISSGVAGGTSMIVIFAEVVSEPVRGAFTTVAVVVTWLIVGVFAGSLAGMLVKRRKEGFGNLANLGIGLMGALIGGLLFKLFRIDLGLLSQIRVSLQEIVAALLGSLIFLGVLWGVQKYRGRRLIS
jgi:uncharacterized membrane protein YeaQ/YmgE (transglycosylase-associated protein family)